MTPRRKHYAALTDVGKVRDHNEDAVLALPPLFVVADGLGGHQAGEVASSVAIEALTDEAPRRPDAKALGRAVRSANRAVIRAAGEGRGRSGMGTTMTAAIVEGTHIVVAHVGDSRAYLLHAGRMTRVTEDHSMVADMIRLGTLTEEESRSHPNRSVITRALGSDPNMLADAFEIDAEPGDRLLLCSDGLTGMLEDREIERILSAGNDPHTTAQALIDAANDAGGHDNISVVVVDVPLDSGERRTNRPRSGRIRGATRNASRGWLAAAIWLLAVVAIVGAVAFGVWRYAQSQAYLIDENGYVTVYRGVPGEFAGISLAWVAEETTVPVDLLSPVTIDRLQEGLRVESVEAARELVEQYREEVAPLVDPTLWDIDPSADDIPEDLAP